MGRTPCFRAQAAFSLYGIPKDHMDISLSGSKCHKATFINSFFTTLGVEALAVPLGVDTTYGNSYCTAYPPANGEEGYYDDDAGDGPGHVEKYDFAGYTSSGTGCKHNRFVTNTFGGANCDGNDNVKTTDTLSSFNKALDKLDCVQIYDSSSGYNYEDNGDGDGEDNHDDNQEAVDFTALDNTVDILKYSIVCDVGAYPGVCPDPHGLKQKYAAKLKSALAKADQWHKGAGEKAMNAFTVILFFLSLLLGVTIIRKRRRLAGKSTAPLKSKAKSKAPLSLSPAGKSNAPFSLIFPKKSKEPLPPPAATSSRYWSNFNCSQKLGMSLIESVNGCRVQSVMEGGQAQGVGVESGHFVTKIGQTPVHTDTSLEKILALIEKETTENSQFIICFRKPTA